MSKNTKEKILSSAKKLFSLSGYDGCSVDAIAEKAAINKASIYYYYRDKASLYEKVFEENLGDFLTRIRREISKQDSPEKKLYAYIFTFSENFQSNQYMAPLMLRELASDGKNLSDNSRKAINNIIKELDKILKDGIKFGVFKETKTVSYSKTLERGSDCQLTRPNILTAIFLMAQMRVEKRLHELRAQIFRCRNAVGI